MLLCIRFGFLSVEYVDERRMKIVEIGGGRELLKMLEGAKDDRTRKEALKALSAISWSGQTFSYTLYDDHF